MKIFEVQVRVDVLRTYTIRADGEEEAKEKFWLGTEICDEEIENVYELVSITERGFEYA